MNISTIIRRTVIGVAVLGLAFATTAFAASGNPPFSTNESWSSCSGSLCIDAPPQGPNGLDGSGGWGWDNTANAPVTSLTVGTQAALTVSVLQPSPCSTGTITITYSSYDFTYDGNGDASAVCTNPFPRGGVISCSYTDFSHTVKSDHFNFTPQNPTNTALVTATVDACGQQVSETFPVAITKQ
jgi:hypothetical protein